MFVGVVEKHRKSTVCFPRAILTTRMHIAVLTVTIAEREPISATVKGVLISKRNHRIGLDRKSGGPWKTEIKELARVVRKRTRLMAYTRPSANPKPNSAVVAQTGTAVPDQTIAIVKVVNDFKNTVCT